MPTYEYTCKTCGDTVEVFQKFTDKPLKKHKECGGELQKVFHARGVVFKGGGFYATDSRSASSGSKKTGANGSDGSDQPKTEPVKKPEKKTKSESKVSSD